MELLPVQDVYRKVYVLGVPIVIGLTQATRQAIPRLPKRFIPWIAILWGIALYVACAILDGRLVGPAALDGLVAGAISVGLVEVSQLLKRDS